MMKVMQSGLRLSSRKIVASLLMLVCLFASGSSSAQVREDENWVKSWIDDIAELLRYDYQRYSREDVAAARSRYERIGSDNSRAREDEWAGRYTIEYPDELGNGTAVDEFRWSPQSGFVEIYIYSCMPELRRLNYGSVVSSSSVVQIFPDYAPNTPRGHEPATRYLKVKWGERHYLIPEDRIAIFCDRAAGLEILKEGAGIAIHDFYLKTDEVEKPVAGLPILPPGYEHFVKKPIDGRITAVGVGYRKVDRENEWWDELIIPVTINVGSIHGVKGRMSFRVSGDEESEKIEVRHAGLRASQGVIVRNIRKKPCVKFDETDDCQNPEYAPIKAGLFVTTNPRR